MLFLKLVFAALNREAMGRQLLLCQRIGVQGGLLRQTLVAIDDLIACCRIHRHIGVRRIRSHGQDMIARILERCPEVDFCEGDDWELSEPVKNGWNWAGRFVG